eukprot:3762492-Prymnesium_polylepis.1
MRSCGGEGVAVRARCLWVRRASQRIASGSKARNSEKHERMRRHTCRGVCHMFGSRPERTRTKRNASSMRVPNSPLRWSTRYPHRSRPSTAVS